MTDVLLVPMSLEILRLPRSTGVAGPILDLESLPWSSAAWGRDVNADTPFMGSAIVTPPFGGAARALAAGFHLHWALPDALCRGRIDPATGKTSFPAVPNRWLVTRLVSAGAGTTTTKRWVVESDHLWPKLAAWQSMDTLPLYQKGLAVTLMAYDKATPDQPFQHVGRAFPWEEWVETSRSCRMASGALTVVGYGDVTFAAYHPHCHSVFGFSDAWTDSEPVPETVEYRVVGWYSDPSQDPLAAAGFAWSTEGKGAQATRTLESHGWRVTAPSAPARTLCFASCKVVNGQAETAAPCTVAVASTGGEAMSVLLAAELVSNLGPDPALRSKIEDQLEALQMRSALRSGELDVVPRLKAARHQRGFHPASHAQLWQITVTGAEKKTAVAPPAELTSGIRDLNALETERHQITLEVDAARQALYSDWCKYMAVAYHPPDEDPNSYPEIDDARDYIERVHLRKGQGQSVPVIQEKALRVEELTRQIDGKKAAVLGLIETYRKTLVQRGDLAAAAPAPLALEQVPGPQFWRPNDPVVLMSGGDVRATRRREREGFEQTGGYLLCQYRSIKEDPWSSTKPDFTGVADGLAVPATVDTSRRTGFFLSDGRPYNPLFLEWGVDLYPAEGHSLGRSAGAGAYDPNVILDNYDLPSRASDLAPRAGLDMVADPDRFDGRCTLSARAGDTLLAQISALITEELLEAYAPLEDERSSGAFRAALKDWHDKARDKKSFYPVDAKQKSGYRFVPKEHAELKKWYLERPVGPDGATKLEDQSDAARFDDPLWTAICALARLFDEGGAPRAFLTASLDGFHDELLGFTKYPVLPIDEPIGFKPYRDFSQAVGALTGQAVLTPEPVNPYSPIRSGELEISGLRLVDSFGQIRDVEPARVLGPVRQTFRGRDDVVYLPPRVVHPMIAKFRWLDAERPGAELTSTPDSEVICGWLVPNPGHSSITVFSREGVGLGLLTIDRDRGDIEWVPAPGQPTFAELTEISSRDRDVKQMDASIANARLRKVVDHIWSAPPEYLEALVNCLVDAQENIDPQGSSEYTSLAMLMGRPLAVGRAELDILPLLEAPTRGDWLELVRRIRGESQSGDSFGQVLFPMRLGEYGQLDDGVAGYWIEDPSGFKDRCFHSVAADDVQGLGDGKFGDYRIRTQTRASDDGASLERFAGTTVNIRQSIGDPPLAVTILFDPRGVVHLTTGILPAKVIRVPPSSFAAALGAIELWLKVGPLLGREGLRDLVLPSDPEFELLLRESSWSKTKQGQDDRLTWDDVRLAPTIRADEVLAVIADLKLSETIDSLVSKSWLSKADDTGVRYHVLPKEKRSSTGFGDTTEKAAEALGDRLAQRAVQIHEPLLGARFDKRAEAREGWMIFRRPRG